MTAVEIIRAKRDGRELSAGPIAAFVRAAAHFAEKRFRVALVLGLLGGLVLFVGAAGHAVDVSVG